MTPIDDQIAPDLEPDRVERPGALIITAVVAGLGAEILIHPWVVDGAPVGLGLPLAVLVIVLALVLGTRLLGRSPDRTAASLYGAAAMFAFLAVVRASAPIIAVDVLASLALIGLAVTLHNPSSVRPRFVSDIARAAVRVVRTSAFGPFLIAGRDLRFVGRRSTERARRIIAGILLALPLLVVFGGLFMSADEVFGDAISSLTSFELPETITPALVLAALLGWIVLGLLRGIVTTAPPPGDSGARLYIGSTETVTATALVNVLFGVFIAFQLFEVVASYQSVDVSYARQARNGFFQLVIVASLVVAAVLVFDWAADESGRKQLHRQQRVLVGLTGVVLISAIVRMAMYVGAYGMTRLRVHTTVFMFWIAFVLVWTAQTVLRGRREQLARPAVTGLFVAVLALNLMNPDGLIADYNLGHHPAATSGVDRSYLTQNLSADAVPAIIAHLGDVGDACAQLAAVEQMSSPATSDLRSWNLARSRATRLLETTRAELSAQCQG